MRVGMSRENFGAFIRRERLARDIGLREMAKMIGVSPTYLSKIERDEFPPPTEEKMKKIAKIIGCNVDVLFAKAGRISTAMAKVIKRHPIEMVGLLRTVKGLSSYDLARLVQHARRMSKRK
jgi:transcriptional regulator with XRE-family HTH domain